MPSSRSVFRFVLLTWFLANVLVPFCVLPAEGGFGDARAGELFEIGFFLFAYSLLFGLPALLIGWALLLGLFRMRLPAVPVYVLWLGGIVALIYVLTNYVLAGFFGSDGHRFWLLLALASFLALLLRIPAYQKLISRPKPI